MLQKEDLLTFSVALSIGRAGPHQGGRMDYIGFGDSIFGQDWLRRIAKGTILIIIGIAVGYYWAAQAYNGGIGP